MGTTLERDGLLAHYDGAHVSVERIEGTPEDAIRIWAIDGDDLTRPAGTNDAIAQAFKPLAETLLAEVH